MESNIKVSLAVATLDNHSAVEQWSRLRPGLWPAPLRPSGSVGTSVQSLGELV